MSKVKTIALGSLTSIAIILICVGVVYWHYNTSGDFVSRAQQTGGEIVNQIKAFNNSFNQVGNWFNNIIGWFNNLWFH